jgi:AcrR family transcriptional regulator
MAAVPQTDDPLLDLAALGEAYRANALENPHLYAVMFGTASLGGYRLHDDELDEGRYTFDMLVAATRRTIEAGIFKPSDPEAIAGQLWSAVHGFVMLELAGYLAADREPDAVDEVLNPMLTGIITALLA